jgi:hypothetical protein
MKELERLLEVSQSARTRALLRAGRAERSPEGFSEGIIAGVAAAAATSVATGSAAASLASTELGKAALAAGTSGVVTPSLALVAVKWVTVGVIGGGLLAAGAELALPAEPAAARAPVASKANVSRHDSARASHVARSDPAPAEPEAAASVARPNSLPAVAPRAGAGAAAVAGVTHGGQLGREVQIIDRVRRALASGNPTLALSELDAYARVARTGALDREARVLRIETMRVAGDEVGARQLADKYLVEFPNDAHTPRLRASDSDVSR